MVGFSPLKMENPSIDETIKKLEIARMEQMPPVIVL
jgi:hypothetical protein